MIAGTLRNDFRRFCPLPSATRMILTYHLNKDRIRPDGNGPEESLRIPLLNRGPVQMSILRLLGSSS